MNFQKILIFGNGISIKYSKNHYDSKILCEKFYTSIKQKFNSWNNILKEDLSELICEEKWNIMIKKINKFIDDTKKDENWNKKINEQLFWHIFEKFCLICENYIINNNSQDDSENSDQTYQMEHSKFKKIYEYVINGKNLYSTNILLKKLFQKIYWNIIYICNEIICIDDEKKIPILILYHKNFINLLEENEYYKIITTNYYLGVPDIDINNKKIKSKYKINSTGSSKSTISTKILENIKFMHGRIILNSDYINKWQKNDSSFEPTKAIVIQKNQCGSYSKPLNIISFGKTYRDKIFLNKLIPGINILDIENLLSKPNNKKIIDIVGLSTIADEDMLKKFFSHSNVEKINIYYHSNCNENECKNGSGNCDKHDYEKLINEWEEKESTIDKKGRINLIPNKEFFKWEKELKNNEVPDVSKEKVKLW